MLQPSSSNFKSEQIKRTLKRKYYRHRLQVRTLNLTTRSRKGLSVITLSTYLPPMWKLTIRRSVKDGSVILLTFSSNTYYFHFPLPIGLSDVKFSPHANLVTTRFLLGTGFLRTYFTLMNRLFYSLSRVVFNKIKFKGKGYYIYKNTRNTITPQFGHSHRIYFYAYNVSVRFLSKTKVLIFGLSNADILKVSHNIKNSRPINIFTGRGVRFAKQVVYKKTGKVSSYR